MTSTPNEASRHQNETAEPALFGQIRRRTGGRFTIFLVSLLFFAIVAPLLPASTWVRGVSEAVFIVLAISAVFDIARTRAFIIAIGLLALVVLLSELATLVWPESNAGGVIAAVMNAAFLSLALYRIGKHVFGAQVVTAETLRGAVAVYLLIGLIWAWTYMALELWRPDSFKFAAPTDVSPASRRQAYLVLRRNLQYFSFVTLSTLGYGDITPNSRPAKNLAWLEAITGQLFIAMTIARLVAIHSSQNRARRDDGQGEA